MMKKTTIYEILVQSLLLSGVVFLAHELSGFLEQMVVAGMQFAWILLFLWYAGFFFLFLIIYEKKRDRK